MHYFDLKDVSFELKNITKLLSLIFYKAHSLHNNYFGEINI